ncbi:permease [Roseibium sp. MMSF_3412]|uniref:permease n=1 Tax=Roseibium sp. MMSF_3412 TaxID=3046712 RepID=UPI00273D9F14|nr:permease [Roseibium sp. MMSF_3412]
MSAIAAPSALLRFSRHELRLAWRDWAWMFSGWRNTSLRRALIGMSMFYTIMHLIAYAVLSPHLSSGFVLDHTALAMLSVTVLLSFTMMLSQAMESVTRAFYARDDLDLILSSPAPSRDLFLVRIVMMALTSWVMSALVISPFLNVAVVLGGERWLSGYAVLLAVSLTATGSGVLITLALFRMVGPQRTRLYAQILAAVVGAAFLIGMQVVAILSFGSISRFVLFDPAFLAHHAPAEGSPWWFPAHAVAGQTSAVLLFFAASVLFFAGGAWCGAVQFRRIVVSALGVTERTPRGRASGRAFRGHAPLGALVHKELTLIARDPWLVSQTLMQVLYLIPPAVMLWVSFGENTEISVIIAPVIVMAVGQLAGGLAWLTISGEDAPDLIATAPISDFTRLWAKVLSVLTLVAAIVLPMSLCMALLSVWGALVTFAGAMTAAASAILVQLWFRAQAKRTNFRRRQVASKASTLAEAAASISCAAGTALVAAGSPLALLPVVLLFTVIAISWSIRPKRSANA